MCNKMCKNGGVYFLNCACSHSHEPNCIKLCGCVQHISYSCHTNLKLLFSDPSLCARHFKVAFDNKPPSVKNLILQEKNLQVLRMELNYSELQYFIKSRLFPTVNFFLIHPVYIPMYKMNVIFGRIIVTQL